MTFVRYAIAIAMMLAFVSAARGINFNVNLSETNTTSDALTALKNCKPAQITDTEVTIDSVNWNRTCNPVGPIDTHVTVDSVAVQRGLHVNLNDTNVPFISDQVTSGRSLLANMNESPYPSFVQKTELSGVTPGTSFSMPAITVAAGDLIFCQTHPSHGGTAFPVTINDTFGTTFTLVTNFGNTAPAWYGQPTSTGPDTISFTLGSADNFPAICAEYTGIPKSVTVDQFASSPNSGTNWSSGTITPSASNELIIGFGWSNGFTFTAGPGFTFRPTLQNGFNVPLEDLIQGAASPIAATMTSSSTLSGGAFAIASFRTTTPFDALGSQRNVFGSMSETVTAVDVCSGVRNGGVCHPVSIVDTNVGGDAVTAARRAVLVNPIENQTASDAIAILRGHLSSPTETHATTDSVAAVAAHAAGLIETNVTNDNVVHGGQQRSVGVTEILSESDSVTSINAHVGIMSDTLSINDTLLVTKCGALQEFLTTVDSVAVVRSALASMSETNTTSDSVKGAINKKLTETLTTVDLINAQKPGSFSLNLSVPLTTNDAVARFYAAQPNIIDTLIPPVGNIAVFHQAAVVLQENLSTSANLKANSGLHAAMSESTTTVDQLAVFGPNVKSVSITETHPTADTVSANAQFFRAASETTTTSDTLSGTRGPFIIVQEVNPTTDALAVRASAHLTILLTDNIPTQNSLSVTSPHAVSLNESLNPLDQVTILGGHLRRRFMVIDSP